MGFFEVRDGVPEGAGEHLLDLRAVGSAAVDEATVVVLDPRRCGRGKYLPRAASISNELSLKRAPDLSPEPQLEYELAPRRVGSFSSGGPDDARRPKRLRALAPLIAIALFPFLGSVSRADPNPPVTAKTASKQGSVVSARLRRM